MTGSATWWDGGTVSVASNAMLIPSVANNQTYNVRICSLRASGATSVWEVANGIDTSSLSPIVYQGQPIGNSAVTVSGTTASIAAINTSIGSTAVTYFPSGATVSGVTPGQTNYIYAVDPGLTNGGQTAQGGNLTPVVTTNQSSYAGRPGYVLIARLDDPN